MTIICLMVRENHKMVREMSGKSQGILWGLMAGHPEQGLHFDSPNLQDSLNLALFCGIREKYAMWKFIVDVVHDFVSSIQPDVGRGFLHVSNVFLLS